jgi:hypothetical protein
MRHRHRSGLPMRATTGPTLLGEGEEGPIASEMRGRAATPYLPWAEGEVRERKECRALPTGCGGKEREGHCAM